jgi:hypothetical protein
MREDMRRVDNYDRFDEPRHHDEVSVGREATPSLYAGRHASAAAWFSMLQGFSADNNTRRRS